MFFLFLSSCYQNPNNLANCATGATSVTTVTGKKRKKRSEDVEEDVVGFIEESAFGHPEGNGPAHLLREAIRATRVRTLFLLCLP